MSVLNHCKLVLDAQTVTLLFEIPVYIEIKI